MRGKQKGRKEEGIDQEDGIASLKRLNPAKNRNCAGQG